MALSIREGIRSLIRPTAQPDDTPPTGQRAIVARNGGWVDVSSDGAETPMRSNVFVQPTSPTATQTQGLTRWTWWDTSTTVPTLWIEDATVAPTPPAAPAHSAYATAVLADAPLAYYKLDETSGNFQDSSGNARHMTLTSPSAYAQPPVMLSSGSSARFVQTGNTRARIQQASWMNTDYFTVSALIKMTSLPAVTSYSSAGYIAGHDDNMSSGLAYCLYVRDAGGGVANLEGTVNVVGANVGILQAYTVSKLSVNTNYHVAMSYDGTRLRMFLNGVENGSNGPYSGTTIKPTLNNSGLLIGNMYSTDGGFPGLIDDVAFFGTALSPTRIAAHYAQIA